MSLVILSQRIPWWISKCEPCTNHYKWMDFCYEWQQIGDAVYNNITTWEHWYAENRSNFHFWCLNEDLCNSCENARYDDSL